MSGWASTLPSPTSPPWGHGRRATVPGAVKLCISVKHAQGYFLAYLQSCLPQSRAASGALRFRGAAAEKAVSLLQWGARPGGGGPGVLRPAMPTCLLSSGGGVKALYCPVEGGRCGARGSPARVRGCLSVASPGHPCGRLVATRQKPTENTKTLSEPGTPYLPVGTHDSPTRAPEAALGPLRQSVSSPHQGFCASALGTRATSLLPQELGNEPFGTLKCRRGDQGQTGGFLEMSIGDVFSGPLVQTRQPSLGGGDSSAEKWADGSNACL